MFVSIMKKLAMLYVSMTGIKFFHKHQKPINEPFSRVEFGVSDGNVIEIYFHKEEIPYCRYSWCKLIECKITTFTVTSGVRDANADLIHTLGGEDFSLTVNSLKGLEFDDRLVCDVLLRTYLDYLLVRATRTHVLS